MRAKSKGKAVFRVEITRSGRVDWKRQCRRGKGGVVEADEERGGMVVAM